MLIFAPYVATVSDIFNLGTEGNLFEVRLFILYLASALIVSPAWTKTFSDTENYSAKQ